MSKPKLRTISQMEPAERVVSPSLSVAELLALRDYHMRMIKRVTSQTGKMAVKLRGDKRNLNNLIRVAEGQVKAHSKRAHEFNDWLYKALEMADAKKS